MKYFVTVFFLLFGLRSFGEVSEHMCNKDNYKDYIFDAKKTRELIKATGKGCFLEGVNLAWKNLKGAHLTKADLSRAILTRAILMEVDLRGADLRGAHLFELNSRGAIFTGANLSGASLVGDFTGVDFTGADLQGAHLMGADFSGNETLEEANLHRAKYGPHTNFPGFDLAFIAGKEMINVVPFWRLRSFSVN